MDLLEQVFSQYFEPAFQRCRDKASQYSQTCCNFQLPGSPPEAAPWLLRALPSTAAGSHGRPLVKRNNPFRPDSEIRVTAWHPGQPEHLCRPVDLHSMYLEEV